VRVTKWQYGDTRLTRGALSSSSLEAVRVSYRPRRRRRRHAHGGPPRRAPGRLPLLPGFRRRPGKAAPVPSARAKPDIRRARHKRKSRPRGAAARGAEPP
jgi:hypothetical protein